MFISYIISYIQYFNPVMFTSSRPCDEAVSPGSGALTAIQATPGAQEAVLLDLEKGEEAVQAAADAVEEMFKKHVWFFKRWL